MRNTGKLSNKIVNAFDKIVDSFAFIAAFLIIGMMFLICVEVASRYFLRQPLPETIEISEYILLYITLLGVAWVLKREGHVKVDIIVNSLGQRTQAILNIATSIAGIIVFFIIAWYGTVVTLEQFQMGYFRASYLRTPLFTVVAIIPAGSLLFAIQFIRRTHNFIRQLRTTGN